MKDVKQCSISTIAFTLEIDAHQTLYNYIESIRLRYGDSPDGEEIIYDIEARVAELILSAHSAERVVAKPLIDNIIAQLGSVDDICEDIPSSEGGEGGSGAEGSSGSEAGERKCRRHLYRNVDDAPIGGVCSGIAAYIGCNAVLIRIIALLLVICWGASIWAYIILWIAVPAAVTARQKLEMFGKPITVSTIRDYYNSLTEDKPSRSLFSSFFAAIGKFIMILLKIIMVCILISFVLAIVAMIIGLFAVMTSASPLINYAVPAMAILSIIMLIGLGIYALVQLLNSRKVKVWPILVTLVVWVVLSIFAAGAICLYNRGLNDESKLFHWNRNVSVRINTSQGDDKSSCDKMRTLEELEEKYLEQ